MSTERKAPARKRVAKKSTKTAKPAAKTAATRKPASGRQSELRAARTFAMQFNFGLSSRVRELLDEKKAVLQVLVEENVPIVKIQEFIQQEYGPKIGLKALSSYVEGSFKAAYPPQAARKATRKPAKKAKKASRR